MLLECIEALNERPSFPQFAVHVVGTIAATLGSAAPVAWYTRSHTLFEPFACAGCDPADLDSIAENHPLPRRIAQAGVPCEIDSETLQALFGRVPLEDSPLFKRVHRGLVAPLTYHGAFSGFIAAGLANGGVPNERLVRELQSVATLCGLVAERDHTDRASKSANQAAQQIQDGSLRLSLPVVAGLDYSIRYQPAGVVSGDFYEVQILTKDRTALAIGDIAGKGIPAALLVANVLDRFRQTIRTKGNDLAALIDGLHRLMFERSPTGSYATMFYAVIDLDHMSLRYACAGHQPRAILVEDSHSATPRLTSLTEAGPPLGMFPTPPAPHSFGGMALYAGDWLIAATDGVTDATNERGDMWGEEAYHAAALQAGAATTADEVAGRLLSAVTQFTGNGRQWDDITILVAGLPRRHT